jgi:hypothetical protein
MNLIQHKIHKENNRDNAAIPTTTPTSHSGIRPVVPVFDISLTFF